MMKTIVFGVVCVALLLWSYASAVDEESFGFGYQINEPDEFSALNDINIGGVDAHQDDNLIDIVKSIVNRVLWILALICLILVIYGGVLMVTSAGKEEQYTKGYAILRAAVIGILIIGVSRFVISGIIWLGQQINRSAEWTTAQSDQ